MKTMFDKLKAQKELNKLIRRYKIDPTYTKNGQAGCAYYYVKGERPRIKLPTPNSIDQFGVGLHEVGHIALGHCLKRGKYLIDKRPSYIHEFEAEHYAIEGLIRNDLDFSGYEIRAKRYILENIAQATNRRHPISKVPIEIVEWLKIDVDKWARAKKVWVPRRIYKNMQEVHNSIKYIENVD